MRNWCFYHKVDFDGECSGAIIKKFLGGYVQMVGINYGDEFPWDEIEELDTVYMVDFGLQPFSDMVKLNEKCNLIWIDHHATAIDSIEESGITFRGKQESGIGACRMVWDYIYPDIEVPRAVILLSEYDVWDHTREETLPFQYGLRTNHHTKPEDDIWNILLSVGSIEHNPNQMVNTYCKVGKTIMEYEDHQNESYCKAFAFPIQFEGLKFIGINRGACSSRVFDSVWDETKYDAMLTFCRSKKGIWNIGMYTDKNGIHVGNVAKKHAGGGHPGAAGFTCDELPFRLNDESWLKWKTRQLLK